MSFEVQKKLDVAMNSCLKEILKVQKLRSHHNFCKALLITVSLVSVSVLYSCLDQEAYHKKILPDKIDRFARDYIELIKSGNIEAASDRISKSKIAEIKMDDLATISHKLVLDTAEAIKPIDATYYKYDDYIEYYAKYKISYKDKQQIALLGVIDNKGTLGIIKMDIGEPSVQSKDGNGVIKTKRVAFILLSFGYLVVIFLGIVQCLRSTMTVKWKSFYSFICLIGITKFLFNFNSGEIAVQILSAGITVPAYRIIGFSGEPTFILSFYIPLGAIIFLAQRKLIVQKLEASKPAGRS